jgi:lantibiotic modifying enzyme
MRVSDNRFTLSSRMKPTTGHIPLAKQIAEPFEVYINAYWPKHHFSNDATISVDRFKVENTDLFERVFSEFEVQSFKARVVEIARDYVPSYVDVKEYGFFHALSPLATYVREEIDKQLLLKKELGLPAEELLNDISNQVNYHLRNEVLSKALVNELHFAREANMLVGDTDEQQFAYYVSELTANPEWIDYFFEEYPLAAHKVYGIILNTSKNVIELLLYFQQEKPLLQAQFNLHESDVINNVSLFAGDAHQRGKAVVL